MRQIRVEIAVVFALLTIGCAPQPVVTYREVTKEDPVGEIKFVLPRSLIRLDRSLKQNEPPKVIAASLPTDVWDDQTPPPLYEILPISSLGVETRLNVTYIDNTRIVSSIGVEVEDNRLKTIGEIAGAIAAAAPLLAVLGASPVWPADFPAKLPIVIDPNPASNRQWQDLPANDGWIYRLDLSSFPADTVLRKEFFAKYGTKTSAFPISACRDATLYLLKTSTTTEDGRNSELNRALSFGLKVADPDRVLAVKLPTKGKVDMHSACGANVTSEKTETASTWALIGEAVKQTTAIKRAYDEAKKKP